MENQITAIPSGLFSLPQTALEIFFIGRHYTMDSGYLMNSHETNTGVQSINITFSLYRVEITWKCYGCFL